MMLRRIGWAQQEMEKEGVTQEQPKGDYFWWGYFCTGSGCIESQTDSYGDCINCGEPVVRVYDKGDL